LSVGSTWLSERTGEDRRGEEKIKEERREKREEKGTEEKNNCAAEQSSMNALSLIGSV